MIIPGKNVRVSKWIHGHQCVVRVEVEAVVPDSVPSEPCLEPATLKWLDELQRMADPGDEASLSQHGEAFVMRVA